MNKIFVIPLALIFLAAGCQGPLSKSTKNGGIYKTTNGGSDWIAVNKTEVIKVGRNGKTSSSFSTDLQKVDVNKLIFAKSNTNTLYTGTTDGLYKSENSGESWKQILSQMIVRDVTLGVGGDKHLLVAGSQGTTGVIVESTDGGGTWQTIYTESGKQTVVNTLAVNPERRSEILAGLNSGGVIKSSDSGKTWMLIQNFQTNVLNVVWQTKQVLVLTDKKGLFASQNVGATFSNITDSLTNTKFETKFSAKVSLPLGTAKPEVPVTSYSRVTVSGDGEVMYLATNAGLFRRTGQLTDWQFVALPKKSVGTVVGVQDVEFGSRNQDLWVSSGSVLYKSENAGSSFSVQTVAGAGVINYILVDSSNSQLAFVGLSGK